MGTNLTALSGDCNDADAALNPATKWYKDADNDGYSDGTILTQCLQPSNYKLATSLTALSGDCNDADPALNPATKWYKDADNDGYSDGTTKTQCLQPPSYKLATSLIAISGDCNDADPALNPATKWILDADGDGYYPGLPIANCSSPGTGYIIRTTQLAGDCQDNNASVNPAAVEVCGNKVDDNCNGVVDEATCYPCQNGNNLKVTSITINSAQLSWSAIANPVQWQLEYKTINQGSKWLDVFLTGNVRTVKLTGLLSNQNYQWQLRAKCGTTWTVYSASIGFKTSSSFVVAIAAPAGEVVNTAEISDPTSLKASPNPFTSHTIIRYTLKEAMQISLAVYDGKGIKLTELVNGRMGAGIHEARLDGTRLAAGIYLYVLETIDAKGKMNRLNGKLVVQK